MLVDALKEMATSPKYQIILTSHSPEIAKQCKNENLILLNKIDGNIQIVEDKFKLKKIADTLGIMPYLSKLVICVEGENDKQFILNINQNISELKEIIDLKLHNINIIPLVGDNLKQWVDQNYLAGSNAIEFHIYDKDNDSKYKGTIDKLAKRKNGSLGVLTQKARIENYITPDLIREHFCIDISSIINEWDNGNIAIFVEDKLQSTSKLKQATIKQIICCCLSKQLTKDKLVSINAYDEIEGWFKYIQQFYEN